jgi:hypothetical protein
VLFLYLILHNNTANSGCLEKLMVFVLLKTIKTSKILQMNLSEYGFRSTIFLDWLVHMFLNR